MARIFKPNHGRGSASFHVEGVSSSVENAAIAYQAPSLLAAGGGAKEVALLSATTNALLAAFLIKIPSVVKHGDALKRAAVILSLVSSLGWVPLILISELVTSISPVHLIALWVINLVPSLLTGPLVDKWLSDLVPSNRIGRYLSIRFILSTGTYISFFFLMGYVLDHRQASILGGFSVVYILALAGSLTSLLMCVLIKPAVPLGEGSGADFGLTGFVREARQSGLGTFIVFTAAIIFAASTSGAFFSIYMLKDLHFSYLTYTLVICTEVLARIAVSYAGGRWIDRVGAIRVLRFASLVIPFNPVLWLFSTNVAFLMGVQIMSGVSWAIYDLSTQSYLCRDFPQEKRLHYIVYHRSIVTLAAAIGPPLGALLLGRMYPVMGNPILGMFLLSGVMRLLVVAVLLPRLKDTTGGPADAEPVYEGMGVVRTYGPPASAPVVKFTMSPLRQVAARSTQRLAESNRPERRFIRTRSATGHPEWDWPVTIMETKQNIRQDLLYRRMVQSQRYVRPPNCPEKVLRLKDNLSRDSAYHRRWAKV